MNRNRCSSGLALCAALLCAPAWGKEPVLLFSGASSDATGKPGLLVQAPASPAPPAPAPGSGPQPAPSSATTMTRPAESEPEPEDLTDVSNLPPTEPEMLGDQPPSFSSFKIGDHESPRPQDRLYLAFNYFNNLDRGVALPAGVRNVNFYGETLGLEKACCGNMSLGLRVPVDTFTAGTPGTGLNSTNTNFGDVSVIFKYALWKSHDCCSNMLTAGMAVTFPSGPSTPLGIDGIGGFHNVAVQPYAGFIWTSGDWYLNGFTSLAVPTDSEDTLLFFNDLGFRYFLYRSPTARSFITQFAPLFEVHVNTPLNHRDEAAAAGFALHDLVDLTAGFDVELFRRARLIVGVANPVTGPRLMDYELLSVFRWSY